MAGRSPARTAGARRIAVLTSAHGAPGSSTAARRAAVAADAGTGVLLLGWALEDGVARWHTPEEISGGALQLLPVPGLAEAVLGTLEPWSDRPAR